MRVLFMRFAVFVGLLLNCGMNTPKAELHELVRSLSAPEKRFFRQFATRKRRKGRMPLYYQLFEQLLKLEEYDETQLRARLKGSALGKRFTEHKYYLQEAIMSALSEFHKQAHINFEIRQLLTEYQILVGKNHLSLAEKRLRKAKVLSFEYERFLYLQEIADYEKDLIFQDFYGNDRLGKLEEVEHYEQQAADDAQVIFEQLHVFHLIADHYLKRVEARSPADLDRMRQLVHAPAYTAPGRLELLRSKLTNASNQILLHAMTGDYAQAKAVSQETLLAFEATPHRINEWPSSYKFLLRNNLQLRIRLDDIDDSFFERLEGLTEIFPYESVIDQQTNEIVRAEHRAIGVFTLG